MLSELKDYLKSKKGDSLPYLELLDRMIERVEKEGENEKDLIIRALSVMEQAESRQTIEALEFATRNRVELDRYFEKALELAIRRRDALAIVELKRLQSLINDPPDTTRTLDQETVKLAVSFLSAKDKDPRLTYRKFAGGDINEADRIKTAVYRLRKEIAKSRSDSESR